MVVWACAPSAPARSNPMVAKCAARQRRRFFTRFLPGFVYSGDGRKVTDSVAVSESGMLMRLRRLFAADLSVADRRNEVPTAVTTGEQEREGDHGGGAARLPPHTCPPRIFHPPLSAHTFHIIPCLSYNFVSAGAGARHRPCA